MNLEQTPIPEEMLQSAAADIQAAMDLSEESYHDQHPDAEPMRNFDTNLPTNLTAQNHERNQELRAEVEPFAIELLTNMFETRVTDPTQIDSFRAQITKAIRRHHSELHDILGDAMILTRGGDLEATRNALVRMYNVAETTFYARLEQNLGLRGEEIPDIADLEKGTARTRARIALLATGTDNQSGFTDLKEALEPLGYHRSSIWADSANPKQKPAYGVYRTPNGD